MHTAWCGRCVLRWCVLCSPGPWPLPLPHLRLQAGWLPQLRALVARVNDSFGANFAQVGSRGWDWV